MSSSTARDPASNQLLDQMESHQQQKQQQEELLEQRGVNHNNCSNSPSQQQQILVTSNGAPVDSLTASMTAGPLGPIVLQDFTLIDHLARFDRERIPERVVHAKGAGARGYFQVGDHPALIQSICQASVFAQAGKQTPVAVRFSTVGGESGSADTARDPRGFAIKFFTDEGNWDLVGNNTPIFFLRDPILFPSFIHTQKRNPATHLKDPDMMWDFFSLRPETIHQCTFLFSDRGTPDGYRHMNGYGSHTFKNVNAAGQAVYVKYHFKTDQGIRCLDAADADRLAAEDPDYAIRDLYNAIARGDYPSWTMYVQVMTYEQAAVAPFNPFDLTRVWPHSDYPLHEVGRLYLNENPKDYFAEVEQLAFSPSHMVPGIEPSPDKMLQARLFSYPDTHRHRLGTNYQSIPCNAPRPMTCPMRGPVSGSYQRDGPMQVTSNGAGAPNYYPNSFQGPETVPQATPHGGDQVTGHVVRVETGTSEDNYAQCRDFFNHVLSAAERERLTDNIAGSLSQAQSFIQKRVVHHLTLVDPAYGRMVRDKVEAIFRQNNHKNEVMVAAAAPAASLNPHRLVPLGQAPPRANDQRLVCSHGYSSKL